MSPNYEASNILESISLRNTLISVAKVNLIAGAMRSQGELALSYFHLEEAAFNLAKWASS